MLDRRPFRHAVLALHAALLLGFSATSAFATCLGDVDGDDAVGVTDLLAVLADWGPCSGCPSDIDGSGAVDVSDLLVVLGEWGPCLFDYGPPRDNVEAERIALEWLGSAGPLVPPDEIYATAVADVDAIRAAESSLVGQTHSGLWAPDRVIVQLDADAPHDDFDALNAYFQVTSVDNLFSNWWIVHFPRNLNVPAVVHEYTPLAEVLFAEPDGLIGGQNFWNPVDLAAESRRWNIDDGFTDCFDGCDCHIYWVLDVEDDGTVTVISRDEVGAPYCEFP